MSVNQLLNTKNVLGMMRTQKVSTFENLLLSTERTGINAVIDFIRSTDFYDAPASSKFHSNYAGGLLDHSLIVYILADKYRDIIVEQNPDLINKVTDKSIILISLLHDICKSCLYTQSVKWKKDSSSNWMQYMSYDVNDTFPIGHGEKSVIMLQNIGLTLNPDEMLAIRYHMGMYEDASSVMKKAQYSATKMTPLVPILQMADFTASSILETTVAI